MRDDDLSPADEKGFLYQRRGGGGGGREIFEPRESLLEYSSEGVETRWGGVPCFIFITGHFFAVRRV